MEIKCLPQKFLDTYSAGQCGRCLSDKYSINHTLAGAGYRVISITCLGCSKYWLSVRLGLEEFVFDGGMKGVKV